MITRKHFFHLSNCQTNQFFSDNNSGISEKLGRVNRIDCSMWMNSRAMKIYRPRGVFRHCNNGWPCVISNDSFEMSQAYISMIGNKLIRIIHHCNKHIDYNNHINEIISSKHCWTNPNCYIMLKIWWRSKIENYDSLLVQDRSHKDWQGHTLTSKVIRLNDKGLKMHYSAAHTFIRVLWTISGSILEWLWTGLSGKPWLYTIARWSISKDFQFMMIQSTDQASKTHLIIFTAS